MLVEHAQFRGGCRDGFDKARRGRLAHVRQRPAEYGTFSFDAAEPGRRTRVTRTASVADHLGSLRESALERLTNSKSKIQNPKSKIERDPVGVSGRNDRLLCQRASPLQSRRSGSRDGLFSAYGSGYEDCRVRAISARGSSCCI